jgi:hypothetical protein
MAPDINALEPTLTRYGYNGLAAPLSLSMSRLRRWRALVHKREPIGVEHEPTA